MKKLLFILVLSPLLSVGQKKGFVINGSLTGIADNSVVSLTDVNNPTDTVAKALVKKNTFVLKGNLPEPGLFNLNFSSVQKKGMLFLDNSAMTISGTAGDIQQLKVVGSPSNKDFQEFQANFTPLFTKLNQLNEQAKMTGMTEDLSAQAIKVTREIQDGVDKFLKAKKGSYVSSFLLLVTAQLSDDVQLLENRYNGLADNVKQSYYGKYVKETLDNNKIGAVGTDAMEFTQNDPDGKPVSLSSFRGKYVLIDFWASWCDPCRRENPNVVNTYNKYKGRNFTVLGVSLDRARDPWLKAIKDDSLTWTHVSDLKYWSNQVAQLYKVQGIPKNFLIDPKGKIIARDLRGPQLAQRLDELLK
jgi:peroxiredoxin